MWYMLTTLLICPFRHRLRTSRNSIGRKGSLSYPVLVHLRLVHAVLLSIVFSQPFSLWDGCHAIQFSTIGCAIQVTCYHLPIDYNKGS